ncbi:AraC family transcriptional regulator [Paenibacillus planticolens]|uniref:Helix-turn-helix domain-containing protein n=1 Tax=Paenibacillus planticolens TaxID=2654976 RepID=A0ABX1ZLJ6_9BACL|nr:AraC family transcriptional regulator [Paenibacillus planticolens]NOV00957.1 helix-turn-helix domain-containing protein [Paenibacillus planticolens]
MRKESTLDNYYFVLSGSSGIVKCEPNWSWQPAPLTDYDLWYNKSGQGMLWLNEKQHDVQPGTFFIFRPGDQIRAVHHSDNPLTVIYCHFKAYHLTDSLEADLAMAEERCVSVKDPYRLEPFLQQLVDSAAWQNQPEDEEFNLLLKLILTRWEKELYRQDETTRNYYYEHIVQRVHNEIRIRLSEPSDYEVLAASTGLTPRYLSLILKRYSGLSLKETITKLRMDRAVHLLNETTMSVTDVSEALGYADIYTFSKLFKRYYGVSPSGVRSNLLKE